MDAHILQLSSGLIQGVLLGIVLAISVAASLKLYGNTSASTRFAVWWVGLIAVVGLTFAPLALQQEETAPAPAMHSRAVSQSQPVSLSLPPVEQPRPAERVTDVSVRIPIGPNAPEVFIALYIFTIMFLAVRLIVSYSRLVRMRRNCKPAPPELTERLAAWLRTSECRRPVDLLVSSSARSPMAVGLGRPAVIIPEALLFELTAEQLDHIALHELAHLRRYDDWNTLAQRVLRGFFFFHPAVHWICRRIEFEREVACDDSVLAVVEAPRRYAESLTKVAELAPWRMTPILASGAVFRKRQIFRRVQTMLNTARDRRPRVSQVTMALVLLIVLGIASELAQLPAFVAMVDGSQYRRSKWSVDGRTIEMQISGTVEFGDDDASVAHVPPSGFLRIEERTGWRGKSVEYRPDSVRYRENGIERPLDSAARAWIAGILPKMIREQGFDAEARALRILQQGGTDGLLREIDRISSDYSRSLYLRAGIESGKIEPEGLRQAAQRIRRISSDHEKANLLIEVRDVYFDGQMRSAWFDAADSISSDHDRRRTVTEAIDRATVDAPTLTMAARVIQRMSSDHDKAEALKLTPPALMSDPETRSSVLRAADSITSDHDKARVLRVFIDRPDSSPAEMDDYCRSVERIGSDHDKANLLIEAASRLTPACVGAAKSIPSDGEKRRVLEKVLTSGGSPDAAMKAIEMAAGISSDHDRAEVLIRAAGQYFDEPMRAAIRKAAQGLSSDSDYRRLNSKLSE